MTKSITILIFLISLFLIPQASFAGVAFDGTDDYIDSANTILTPSAFTVLAWFKRLGDSGGSGLSSQHQIVGGINTYLSNRVLVKKDGTEVKAGVWVDGALIFSTIMSISDTSSFHQVGAIWDGTNVYTVLDGVISAATSASGTLGTSSDKIIIGRYNANNFLTNGNINEVALWDTALTSTEIATLANSKFKGMPLQIQRAHLVGYWPMSDGADGTSADGDTIADQSGSGNNGIGVDGDNNEGLTYASKDWEMQMLKIGR